MKNEAAQYLRNGTGVGPMPIGPSLVRWAFRPSDHASKAFNESAQKLKRTRKNIKTERTDLKVDRTA